MRTVQLVDARLSQLAEEVEATSEPVVLVREGHEDVMIVPAADVAVYRAWMSYRETAELMADPEAQSRVEESQAEYARGEFTTGEEARARFGLPPFHEPS